MSRITIRTVGNRSLYRSLYEAYDSETHHKTASGAATRLMRIERVSRDWAQASGMWGDVKTYVDGKAVDLDDEWRLGDLAEEAIKDPLERHRLVTALQHLLDGGEA